MIEWETSSVGKMVTGITTEITTGITTIETIGTVTTGMLAMEI
jgi:hypothetical protein